MTMHNTKAPNQQSVGSADPVTGGAQARTSLGAPVVRPQGLSSSEAASRLAANGPTCCRPQGDVGMVLWRQVKSPILLLLVVAAVLSFVTGDARTRPSSW